MTHRERLEFKLKHCAIRVEAVFSEASGTCHCKPRLTASNPLLFPD
jgi:hypothetical protein